MKKTEKQQFGLVSRARNKMFEARELRVTVPAFGRFDLDKFKEFLGALPSENSSRFKDIKQWAIGDTNQIVPPREGNAPVEPLSEDWFRLNASKHIEEIEKLLAKMNFSAEDQPSIDALIAHCISLGRTHSRAESQRKFLKNIEVGKSVEEGGRSAGKAKEGQFKHDTNERLERMDEFIAAGASRYRAAKKLASENPAWRYDANRNLLRRHRS